MRLPRVVTRSTKLKIRVSADSTRLMLTWSHRSAHRQSVSPSVLPLSWLLARERKSAYMDFEELRRLLSHSNRMHALWHKSVGTNLWMIKAIIPVLVALFVYYKICTRSSTSSQDPTPVSYSFSASKAVHAGRTTYLEYTSPYPSATGVSHLPMVLRHFKAQYVTTLSSETCSLINVQQQSKR